MRQTRHEWVFISSPTVYSVKQSQILFNPNQEVLQWLQEHQQFSAQQAWEPHLYLYLYSIYTYIYTIYTLSIPISIFSILYLYLKVSKIIFISPGFTGSGVAGGSLAAAAQVSSCLREAITSQFCSFFKHFLNRPCPPPPLPRFKHVCCKFF